MQSSRFPSFLSGRKTIARNQKKSALIFSLTLGCRKPPRSRGRLRRRLGRGGVFFLKKKDGRNIFGFYVPRCSSMGSPRTLSPSPPCQTGGWSWCPNRSSTGRLFRRKKIATKGFFYWFSWVNLSIRYKVLIFWLITNTIYGNIFSHIKLAAGHRLPICSSQRYSNLSYLL